MPRSDDWNFNMFGSQAYVYFIAAHAVSRFKIGSARRIKSRLHSLSVASPVELSVYGFIRTLSRDSAYGLEVSLQKLFEKFHYKGEWYRLNGTTKSMLELLICSDFLCITQQDRVTIESEKVLSDLFSSV